MGNSFRPPNLYYVPAEWLRRRGCLKENEVNRDSNFFVDSPSSVDIIELNYFPIRGLKGGSNPWGKGVCDLPSIRMNDSLGFKKLSWKKMQI